MKLVSSHTTEKHHQSLQEYRGIKINGQTHINLLSYYLTSCYYCVYTKQSTQHCIFSVSDVYISIFVQGNKINRETSSESPRI